MFLLQWQSVWDHCHAKKKPLPSDTFQVSQDFCTALHFGVAADHKSTLSAEVKCGPRKKADVTHILVKQSALCVLASARPGVPKQSVAGSLLILPSKLKRHLSSSVENLGFNRAVDLNRDYLLNRMKPSATYCNAKCNNSRWSKVLWSGNIIKRRVDDMSRRMSRYSYNYVESVTMFSSYTNCHVPEHL